MTIAYAVENDLSAQAFKDILMTSTLGERRPIDDMPRLEKMLRNANLIVTARLEGKLVGVLRALTDYAYCCYVSDLAVDLAYQKQGIGRSLILKTHRQAGSGANFVLLSAPESHDYYEKIGMTKVENGWIIPRETSL